MESELKSGGVARVVPARKFVGSATADDRTALCALAMVAPDKPTLEVASSNRSSCQRCKEKIEKGEMRAGMPSRHNGLSVTKWLKPACLVKNLRVDYAPTGRAKCKGDGSPIAKGEPRVLFRILDCLGNVNSQCIFKPPNAAEYLAELGRCEGVTLDIGAIDGMDELEPEHRAWTKSALAGGEAVASTPRREAPEKPKAPKKRKAAAEGDDAADAAAAPKKAKKKAAPKKAPPPEESSDDSAPEDVE